MADEISVGSVVTLTSTVNGNEKGTKCTVLEMMRGGYLYLVVEGGDPEKDAFSIAAFEVELAAPV